MSAMTPFKKGEWVQHYDDHGQEYWVSEVTGESLWEIPSENSGVLSGEGMSIGEGMGDSLSVDYNIEL